MGQIPALTVISNGNTSDATQVMNNENSIRTVYNLHDTAITGVHGIGAPTAVAAMNIDWSLNTIFTKTLAAGANTFTFSNESDGSCIYVLVTGAASTLTWPTVLWSKGIAPTQTASGTDLYLFIKIGADIIGSRIGDLS